MTILQCIGVKYAMHVQSYQSSKWVIILYASSILHNLYSSPNIIRMIKSRRMRWAWHVVRIGEKRNAYRILVGKPEGTTPLGRPRRRCVDNIKIDLREIGRDGMDWIDLAQDRVQWRTLVNMVMKPSGSIKCWEVLEVLHNW
jgi:hypothetical protein